MKRMRLKFCIVAACLAFLFLLSACDWGTVEGIGGDGTTEHTPGEFEAEGRLYFGKDKSQALLVDDNGIPGWIYPSADGMLEKFNTGDRVKVMHGGVMLSYPSQTYITSISLITDGDESVFREEELKEIMKVIGGFK